TEHVCLVAGRLSGTRDLFDGDGVQPARRWSSRRARSAAENLSAARCRKRALMGSSAAPTEKAVTGSARWLAGRFVEIHDLRAWRQSERKELWRKASVQRYVRIPQIDLRGLLGHLEAHLARNRQA